MQSVGMLSAYMAVSDTRATSAASLSGFSATYFAMEEPPISSSPSTRKRMWTGSVPVVVLRAGIGDEVGGAFDVGAVFGQGSDARNPRDLLHPSRRRVRFSLAKGSVGADTVSPWVEKPLYGAH